MRTNSVRLVFRLAPSALSIGLLTSFSCGLQASVPIERSIASSVTSFQSLVDSDLLVLGPVESISLAQSKICVLGQVIDLDVAPETLSVGDLVAIYGTLEATGAYKVTAFSHITSAYVAGATELFLKGAVSSIDAASGTLKIGTLSINYTAALHSLSADAFSAGAIAVFRGLEFSKIASLYATNAALLTRSEGQIVGNALETRGQVGGNALETRGQVGGNALETRGQVGGNALETRGQVGGNALETRGQVGGNAL